ncbi:MAG: hypothetical protein MUF72_17910 [Elainella sp. Prado103]|jgi:hypothetical protein|nr:hypothetical protein [Elainella sp. Prado103]
MIRHTKEQEAQYGCTEVEEDNRVEQGEVLMHTDNQLFNQSSADHRSGNPLHQQT